ncbi:cell division protein SepF [Candidatus Bathyarchaeota archaeon]|nr:cell division protein SepF [Candidatus Bathyarchaeota archaeon]
MANPGISKVIDKIIGKRREKKEEIKVEEKEEAPTVTLTSTSKIYLKALPLHSPGDLEKIKSEIKAGNILIIKIEPSPESDVEDIKRAIGELSEFAESMGCDIARLGEERIVVTPPTVQIWKEKG